MKYSEKHKLSPLGRAVANDQMIMIRAFVRWVLGGQIELHFASPKARKMSSLLLLAIVLESNCGV